MKTERDKTERDENLVKILKSRVSSGILTPAKFSRAK